MAKWGEGDPRWIVEERPDATNVNNWHWSEKDAGKWSKDRLKALLLDVAFNADGKRVRINEVEKIEGEAIVNNRKAKLIYLYDWKITGKWEGVFDDASSASPLISGTFEINGLSDENDVDEVDVEILTADTSDEGYDFKTLVRNVGIIIIRQTLQTYVDELKKDFAKDLIKPMTTTTNTMTTTKVPKTESKPNGVVAPAKKTASSSSSSSTSAKSSCSSTTRISIRDSFRCDADRLFDILTDPKLIAGWTQSPVDFELTRGAGFRLFDGNVSGVVVDFQTGASLKLKWRFKSWMEDHFSDVELTLGKSTSGDGKTTIKLEQSGVPSDEKEATVEGWKRNIFRAMKATFGIGELTVS